MSTRGGNGRLLRITVIGAMALGLFGVGLAVGRSGASGGTSPTTSSPAPASSAGIVPANADGPTRTENGVPIGYTQTKRGAAAAATTYASVLAGPLMPDASAYRAAVTEMIDPAAAASVVPAIAAARDQIDSSFGMAAARQAGRTVAVRAIPVSYNVDSYTGSVALVRVWTLEMVAVEGSRPAFATWATNTYTLQWTDSDWRMAAAPASTSGPVPNQGGDPTSDAGLPDQLKTFTGYGYVPG